MTSHHPSQFGVLLRRYRLASGLTQEKLAEGAGISGRAISDLERGIIAAPREDTAQRLADALKLSPEDWTSLVKTARDLRFAGAEGAPHRDGQSPAPAASPLEVPREPEIRPSTLPHRPFLRRARPYGPAAIAAFLSIAAAGLLWSYGFASHAAGGPSVPLSSRPAAIWSSTPPAAEHLRYPVALALDTRGDVYVADFERDIVQEYAPDGRPLTLFGRGGVGTARFDGPVALTVDRAGSLYVLDSRNGRLQKVSQSGQSIAQWRLHGNSVAVDSREHIYLLDGSDNVVHELSPRGREVASWGGSGDAPGQFSRPVHIAVGPNDSIYVDDIENSRIEEFAPTTHALLRVLAAGQGGPGATGPSLAIGATGAIYEPDIIRAAVFKLDANGKLLARWGEQGTLRGVFQSPESVAVDRHGNVYVADADRGRVVKLSPKGRLLGTWAKLQDTGLHFSTPLGVATDAAGNAYVVQENAARILKLSSNGHPVSGWDGRIPLPYSGYKRYQGIAVDSAGRVYVAVVGDKVSGILAFSPAGRRIRTIERGGCDYEGVAVTPSGNLLITDSGNNQILTFTRSGTHLNSWGDHFSGKFSYPTGVAVDSAGNTYVVDTDNSQIDKLDPRGVLLARWGEGGSGPLQFDFTPPVGPGLDSSASGSVAVDRQGRIYVVDPGNSRVQILSPEGKLLQILGGIGSGPGEFIGPEGLALDGQGRLYVADTGNNRIEVFAPL